MNFAVMSFKTLDASPESSQGHNTLCILCCAMSVSLAFMLGWLFLLLLSTCSGFILKLRDGTIEGDATVNPADGRPVLQFLGIPYAQPPLAVNRFRRPVPAEQWDDVRKPYRRMTCFRPGVESERHSEDCLYLDIWVPGQIIPDNKFIPVLVYFSDDDEQLFEFDGMTLATQQNVTVVFFDHRRGPFGFARVTRNEDIPGNQGFLDQVLLLQWLQSNVGKFGGDKDRITLFGHGTGAALASLHLTARKSVGLFNSIVLSGETSLRKGFLLEDSMVDFGTHQLAQSVSCNALDVKCLQSVDAAELAAKRAESVGPYLDDVVIGGTPQDLFERRRLNSKRVMLGTTSNTGFPAVAQMLPAVFQTNDWFSKEEFVLTDLQHAENSRKLLPREYADDNLAHMLVHHEYARWSHGTPTKRQLALEKTFADHYVTCPSVELARLCAIAGCDTYVYRFEAKVKSPKRPDWMGVSKGSDIAYLFGVPLASDGFSKKDKALSSAMMLYLGNFMRTGNPNYGPAGMRPKVTWPEYTLPSKRHLTIGETLKPQANLREQFCHFWKYYLPAVLSLADGTYGEPKFSEKEMFEEESTEHAKYKGDAKPSACPFH